MKKLLLLSLIFSISVFAHGQQSATFSVNNHWNNNFEKLEGVSEVVYGFVGEHQAIQVIYNENIISYRQLLNTFFRAINPTNSTSFIYTPNRQQIAKNFIAKLENSKYFVNTISVGVVEDFTFVRADNQQQILAKNTSAQHTLSMFDRSVSNVWDEIPQEFLLGEEAKFNVFIGKDTKDKFAKFVKPSRKRLRNRLSEVQFAVTQLGGTETPYHEGNFHDNEQRGIYVDIVSGEPLFSSLDKTDLKNGYPSFKSAISDEFVVEVKDLSMFYERRKVYSRYGKSHLGYITEEGYYIINGSALRFVPYESMESEGYESSLI